MGLGCVGLGLRLPSSRFPLLWWFSLGVLFSNPFVQGISVLDSVNVCLFSCLSDPRIVAVGILYLVLVKTFRFYVDVA